MKNINPAQYCQSHSLKMTPLRQQVVDILAKQTHPLTAYAVLDILKKENPKAQAMSVYRVLKFLQTNGLVHRIENLNAFMICQHLSENHLSQWLICESCGVAKECVTKDFQQGIAYIEKDTGFSVTMPTIELMGICHKCQNNADKR